MWLVKCKHGNMAKFMVMHVYVDKRTRTQWCGAHTLSLHTAHQHHCVYSPKSNCLGRANVLVCCVYFAFGLLIRRRRKNNLLRRIHRGLLSQKQHRNGRFGWFFREFFRFRCWLIFCLQYFRVSIIEVKIFRKTFLDKRRFMFYKSMLSIQMIPF